MSVFLQNTQSENPVYMSFENEDAAQLYIAIRKFFGIKWKQIPSAQVPVEFHNLSPITSHMLANIINDDVIEEWERDEKYFGVNEDILV